MTRARIVRAVAALALIACVACATGPAARLASSTPLGARTAIDELLARRASAWLARDQSSFMATTARTAEDFVVRQQQSFRWSEDVEFGSYELRADWERYGDLVTATIRDRYPAADDVAVLSVEERYRLSGFDRKPAVEDLYYTFVNVRGKWLVANDTDVDTLTLYTARHPWDFDRLEADERGNFLVLSHPCRKGALCGRVPAGAIELAATALEQVDDYWTVAWHRRVAVLVPRDADELERLLQVTFDVDNFVAFATSSVDPRGGIDYTGHRIVLNPQAFVDRPSESTFEILTHELLHVATRDASGPFIPVWVEEGFAEHVGTDADPQALGFLNARVSAGLTKGHLPDDYEFTIGGRTDIFLRYQGALSAVRFFINRWGLHRFVRFYRLLGRVEIAPGTARWHIERALKKTIDVDLDEFERAWTGSLS
ncbi:MAG: hypothetical protein ACRDJV_02760 [Actinomycetota bacterium]